MWAWGRGGGTEDVTMGTWHWWGGGTGGVTVGGTVVTWGRPALPCPNPSVAMPPPGDVPPLHGDTPIPPTPQRFQEVEEAHLRHMKGLIGSYSHSVEDTHVQIGQVSPPPVPWGHPPGAALHPTAPLPAGARGVQAERGEHRHRNAAAEVCREQRDGEGAPR